LPPGRANKFSFDGSGAGAGYFQPPSPLRRRAVDADIPTAVEFLIVDGSSAADNGANCNESYSHAPTLPNFTVRCPVPLNSKKLQNLNDHDGHIVMLRRSRHEGIRIPH